MSDAVITTFSRDGFPRDVPPCPEISRGFPTSIGSILCDVVIAAARMHLWGGASDRDLVVDALAGRVAYGDDGRLRSGDDGDRVTCRCGLF